MAVQKLYLVLSHVRMRSLKGENNSIERHIILLRCECLSSIILLPKNTMLLLLNFKCLNKISPGKITIKCLSKQRKYNCMS
jgi:hypothetical protein